MWDVDFARSPFLVVWETTLACELACRHCRANAIPGPVPGELSTSEGKRLVDQVAEMGTPLLVFSGGDPASRPDLPELIAYGKSKGLRVATVPAATSRLTPEWIHTVRAAGIDQIALSLDFPSASRHDGFRGVRGTFERTIQAARWIREAEIPLQINTCVWSESATHLSLMADVVAGLGAVFWEVFFLVPVGRGSGIQGLDGDRCEELFGTLLEAQKRNGYVVKVTEAPHYRRYLRMRHEQENGRISATTYPPATTNGHNGNGAGHSAAPLARRGTNAGNGFLFVSHLGMVFPNGFLPVPVGNVRNHSLSEIYRTAPLLLDLRDPEKLTGKCGVCPFRQECGGSRARAFAVTGDPLAADPWCAYVPPGWAQQPASVA